MYSKNLTIMFTDMKGFTNRTSIRSREDIEKLIDLQDKLILPVIERFGGKVVKTIGDSYMVTFDSPTSAVICGRKIIEATIPYFGLKIAINTGEVNCKPSDIFGEPVNLAARLETAAEAGEVYLTEAVYLAMNKNETPLACLGTRIFKGIPRPVKIYKVIRKKSFAEDIKNWLALRYLKFVPLFLLLSGFIIIGIFLYFGRNKILSSAIQATPLLIPTLTPTPTPSPSPTSIPTPIIQQIIIREILVTPKPTPTPTPIPTPRFHKR